jgi:addiction module RelB/DinJ family antitoxin
MNASVINIRTDTRVKLEAQAIAKKMGLTLSGLINGYLRDVIKIKKVVFLASEEPSKYLVKVLRKSEEDRRLGRVSPAFNNADDAIAWLNNPKAKYAHNFQPEIYKAEK